MEDEIADAAAFEGTSRLQILKLEKHVAIELELLQMDGKLELGAVPACSF